jgi:8-oxo-dGTP pyrophosphatase MutT (NUDIX family)
VIDPDFVRLHADAMGVLGDWTHPEPQQRMLRDAYLTYLREHPDAMSRECRIGHLTASALVMDEHRTRVLLTLHPKVGRWLQLGGHVEIGDASLGAAAHRETVEESGIADVAISDRPLRLDRHPVPCGGAQSEHLDVQYLALVAPDARAVMSHESDDLRWFDVTALPEPLDPSVRALIDTALQQ